MVTWRPMIAVRRNGTRRAIRARCTNYPYIWYGLIVLCLPLGVIPITAPAADAFAAPVFQRLWARTDQPVANGQVSRPYVWGPSPIAVVEEPMGVWLVTNGFPMSATSFLGQRYMRAFVHLPMLISERIENVMVMCFGVGNTVNATLAHPGIRLVDVVDLSQDVLEHAGHFAASNGDALADPRVNWERKGVKRGGFSVSRGKSVEWKADEAGIARLKKHVAQSIAVATGGPTAYEGRDMKEVHRGMRITNPEFDAAVGDLKASLDKLGVPTEEQKELLAVVESTRPLVAEER